MVSFQCDNCCDVVKKPKLDQHRQRCHATFTCIDCSTTFQHMEYKSHTSCITEAEKYQKSLYRKKGNNNSNNTNANAKQQQQQQNKAVEEKPKETNTAKPLSLIDELKQKKQQEGTATETTKRKADEEDKGESKKKQKKGKWEQVELPLDNKAKMVQLALQEVLSKANTTVSIKDCRKKVIKLIASHPKASKKLDKSDVKDVFDEALLLGVEGDKLIVKTA